METKRLRFAAGYLAVAALLGGTWVYSQTAPGHATVSVSATQATLTIALWEDKSYLIRTVPGQPPAFDPVTIAYIKLGGSIPGPEPKPDPLPNPVGFKAEIKSALAKVPANAQPERKTIADLYRSLCAEAAATPASWDAALLFNEKKQRVATELSAPMLAAWQGYFREEATALAKLKIEASDLKAGVQALTDAAEVLSQ